jgi:hypothetical protein
MVRLLTNTGIVSSSRNLSVLCFIFPSLGECVKKLELLMLNEKELSQNQFVTTPWDIFPGDYDGEIVFSLIKAVGDSQLHVDTFYTVHFIPFSVRIYVFGDLVAYCKSITYYSRISCEYKNMTNSILPLLMLLRSIKQRWFLTNLPQDKFGNYSNKISVLYIYNTTFEIKITFLNWKFLDFVLLPIDR